MGLNCGFIVSFLSSTFGSSLLLSSQTPSLEDCLTLCKQTKRCTNFYRDRSSGICSLFPSFMSKSLAYTNFNQDCGIYTRPFELNEDTNITTSTRNSNIITGASFFTTLISSSRKETYSNRNLNGKL